MKCNGYELMVKIEGTKTLSLVRADGTRCWCPYSEASCASHCAHFVVEKLSLVDNKCQIILTCGNHLTRYLEILS